MHCTFDFPTIKDILFAFSRLIVSQWIKKNSLLGALYVQVMNSLFTETSYLVSEHDKVTVKVQSVFQYLNCGGVVRIFELRSELLHLASVGWSDGQSVGLSVGLSVRNDFMEVFCCFQCIIVVTVVIVYNIYKARLCVCPCVPVCEQIQILVENKSCSTT